MPDVSLAAALLMLTCTAVSHDPPALAGAQSPRLARDGDALLLSWLEPAPADRDIARGGEDAAATTDRDGRTWRMQLSRFEHNAWSEPVTIVERDDLFVNWADIPSVTPGGDGALYAHWPQKSGAATYAYDVMLARSTDDGATWNHLGKAHDDHTQTEHGFVSLVPMTNGADGEGGATPERGGVHAFWLDGREMTGGHDDGGDGHGGGGVGGNMTLRTAVIGDAPGEAHVLDARVCECCNTDAAVTSNGPIIVYRDRGPDERRDISIVRWLGEGWSVPRDVFADGWILPGCPVNGPAAAARGNDVIVVWFTGVGVSGAVLAAWSDDGGATFGEPITIDDSFPIGRTDVAMLDDGSAVVTWLDIDDDIGGAIRAVRLSADGMIGEPVRIAASDVSRAAGFPKIELIDGDRMMMIWTEDDNGTRLRADVVSIPAIE